MSQADRERYARDRERIRARQLGYAKEAREQNRQRERDRPAEWRVWQAMKRRCYNPRAQNYKYYGGRGITVCERWRDSFAAFSEDMGPRPTPKHTIDRKDNDGNYEPENCKWSTPIEQRANRRDTKRAA